MANFRKPWERREDGGERRPFRPARQSEGFGGSFSRKPRREGGAPFRKPWERGEEDGGERRPFDRPFERKPRREGGAPFRKPWERGEEDGGERRPFDRPFERKPRREGGAPFRRPWERGEEDGGERRPFDRPFERKPRREGDTPFRKPWERGEEDGAERRPFDRPFARKPRREGGAPFGKPAREGGDATRKPRAAAMPAGGELLYGRQPVREMLRAGRRKVNLVVLSDGVKDSDEVSEIKTLCEGAGVKIEYFRREDIEAWTSGANHQGVCAFAEEFPYADLDEIAEPFAAAQGNATVVVLDHVQDPQNLGSILRTCECAGVVGVVLPAARAVAVTPAAVRASAGAAEHLRIARVSNLVVALERFKGCGAWITGLEAVPNARPYAKIDYSGKVCLVIGSENHGICSPVRRKCDFMARLPLCGSVNSLNAGVAAALALYEVLRQHGVNDDPAAFPAVDEPPEAPEAEPAPEAGPETEPAPETEAETEPAPETEAETEPAPEVIGQP